ncbi:Beta-lactamase [Candidatus Sulfopaludibacter sp. SbA3]|nr:Beta-lactamase [Candidatus Sulfopaludibacter sp. SbA3]
MQVRVVSWAFLALFSSTGTVLAAQADDSALRMKTVESGLVPSVSVSGSPAVERTIQDRMRAYHVPGVSIAVIQDYRIDWAKGYGVMDLGSKVPVSPETRFQAGSISKPVAAAGALKLVEDGKVALDEDVNAKLRSWKVPENAFTREQKVTLRRLLSHSAGLTVHGFPGYPADAPLPSLIDILNGKNGANTPAVVVDTLPGTAWRYSGGGITVMQLLMTDVTGSAFADLMQRLVLSKVGMSNSSYQQPVPAVVRPFTATGYNPAGMPVPGKYHTYPEMAAAGLWTTPTDLAKFCIEIQKSREGHSNAILNKKSVTEMLTLQKGEWGLGFQLNLQAEAPRFLHGGADEGFRAELICGFDGSGAIVMANSDNGSAVAHEVIQAIANAYHWRRMEPKVRSTAPLDAAALQKYAGTYDAGPFGNASIRVQGDHLVTSSALATDLDLYPASEVQFFPLTSDLPDVRFSRDDKGEVVAVSMGALSAKKVR